MAVRVRFEPMNKGIADLCAKVPGRSEARPSGSGLTVRRVFGQGNRRTGTPSGVLRA